MASIDSVLNAYLLESGYSWQPRRRVRQTRLDGGGLPNQSRATLADVHAGTLTASFPSQAAYQSFLTFWSANHGLVFTWTNPDENLVYNCRFVSEEPGYQRQGQQRHVVVFELEGVR